jgi:carbamoyl-phosphate synthase large subunit
MRKLKIIVTGAGAPGIEGTLYSLKKNYDKRETEIIGTDINRDVAGRFLCDKFFTIARASEKETYLKSLIEISEIEHPDIILPQNTSELELLAGHREIFEKRGIKIVVSNKTSLLTANNKVSLLEMCRDNGLPYPKFFLADNIEDLESSLKKLNWPNVRVIVKPPVSNGMRGFRIIDEKYDHKTSFYSQKPDSSIISFNDLSKILGSQFPPLLVTEYLPGEEYSVDLLRTRLRIDVVPRKRTMIRSGITFNGALENNIKIIEMSKKLSELLNMEYCFGLQFKMDSNGNPQLLECNPRVQGTMVMSTIAGANLIYSAVKHGLGETIPEFDIDWNSVFFRYWGGIGLNNNQATVI